MKILSVYRLRFEYVTSRIRIKIAMLPTQTLDCWTQYERRTVDRLQCRII